MGHGDPPHAELESGRPLDLVRQAVGGADDERHVPRPAAARSARNCASSSGGDLFSLNAHGHDGGTLADIAEDGLPSFSSAFFDGIGGVFLLDLLFRQLNDPEICKGCQPLVFGYPLRKIFCVELLTQIRSIFCIIASSFQDKRFKLVSATV